MFTSPYPVELSADERMELEKLSRSRSATAALVQRAQMILAMADGVPYAELGERFNTSTTTLTRWRKRYMEGGLAGLTDKLKQGRGDVISAEDEAKILAATQKAPPKPLTHWTTRRLARKLGFKSLDDRSRLETGRPQAAPAGTLHVEPGSGFRGQGG
jgi:transposase